MGRKLCPGDTTSFSPRGFRGHSSAWVVLLPFIIECLSRGRELSPFLQANPSLFHSSLDDRPNCLAAYIPSLCRPRGHYSFFCLMFSPSRTGDVPVMSHDLFTAQLYTVEQGLPWGIPVARDLAGLAAGCQGRTQGLGKMTPYCSSSDPAFGVQACRSEAGTCPRCCSCRYVVTQGNPHILVLQPLWAKQIRTSHFSTRTGSSLPKIQCTQ